ncbi:MAG TPA: hypothetical protein VHB30_10045 [Solirubrobacteraceae bacterium]|jgi:hypothetical protein|nr:hypothetical protein [Solirubrobacteraceae bacterium]
MRAHATLKTRPGRIAERARELHLIRRAASPIEVEQVAARPASEGHRDEQRVRDAGGPIDRAQYVCACGYVFEAAVSTSVSCPHCGAAQAW